MDTLRQVIIEMAKKIDDEDFANVWNAADSREAVAKHFNISPENVSVRANQLRNVGVELKKFSKGRKNKEQGATISISRDEFRKTWNASSSINDVVNTLNVSRGVVNRLASTFNDNSLKSFSVGRKKLLDISLREFAKIWNESADMEEVVHTLITLGLSDMHPLRVRRYATSMAHKAKKQYELKKFDRPIGRVYLKDIPLNDDLSPEDRAQTDKDPERLSGEELSESETEFMNTWNEATTFKDALKTLRKLGWMLDVSDIKDYANALKMKGHNINKF